ALLGRVGNWTFLIGSGTTVSAQASGQLALLMNDFPNAYRDNGARTPVTATVSLTPAGGSGTGCPVVLVPSTCGSGGGGVVSYNATISLDRGDGGTYAIGDPITICFVVSASPSTGSSIPVLVTDSGPGGTNQIYAGPTPASQTQCVHATVAGPTGTDTISIVVTSASGAALPGQTPA